jgi:hypothetical protein
LHHPHLDVDAKLHVILACHPHVDVSVLDSCIYCIVIIVAVNKKMNTHFVKISKTKRCTTAKYAIVCEMNSSYAQKVNSGLANMNCISLVADKICDVTACYTVAKLQ